ncbi:MAG: hypothetical protein HOP11_15400 [Saprospiraceae bacterium]|nr:hypothetical protein [Saprospiraceae bacterium]
MKEIIQVMQILVVILILIFGSIKAQKANYQSTNYYVNSIDELKFISSLDGVVIFNSKDFILVRISNSQDQNIQSSFYKDSLGTIWSSSYTNIICKPKNKSKFNEVELKDPDGIRVNSDYKVFGIFNNCLIFKAGDFLIKYNTIQRKIMNCKRVNLRDVYYGTIVYVGENTFFYYGLKDTLYKINLSKWEEDPIVVKVTGEFFCIENLRNKKLVIGFKNGIIGQLNLISDSFHLIKRVGKLTIQGIKGLNNEVAVISNGDIIFFWNFQTNELIDSIKLKTNGECNLPLSRLMNPYVDPDSILWIGSDGYGIVSYNLKQHKFNLIKEELCNYNTLAILTSSYKDYYFVSRNGAISYFDLIKSRTKCLIDLAKNPYNPVFYKSAILLDSCIYLCTWSAIYSLDLRNLKFCKLKNLSDPLSELFELKLGPGNKVFATGNKNIVELDLTKKSFNWKFLDGVPRKVKNYTYFDFDEIGNLYAGYNEETILYYEKLTNNSWKFIHEYNISGGVKCVSKLIHDSIRFISTSTGFYKISYKVNSYSRIIDSKGLLDQTIYAVYPHKEYLWLSSNTGILRLNPNTMDLHQFTEKDGLQGSEFNTFSYCFSKNGNVFFGGTNGVNYFNPDSVKLSDKEVPVRITDFRINDVVSDRFEEPDIIETLQLPYSENTLSFEIISVDFHDQSLTRVMHKLEGIDNNYITSSTSTGIIRYANLAPGSYKLHIIGSNADKVWNKAARIINIQIVPPFWMTSWFRLLSIFLILSLAYKLIRDYYKRQLEKKNLLLKQQQLIIEKQEAVEKERTRIASEMHDDLGSGLTTIKYLSDRALKNVSGDEEKVQIEKIADQSNTLVRNMSEIIWAMNSRFDNLGNLLSYIRRYTIEYLEEHKIQVQWEQLNIDEQSTLSGAKRRSIFLVIKEALHNIVKHSEANNVIIRCSEEGFKVRINVVDDGVGFDPLTAIEKGNGLYNMKNRMKEIAGNFEIIALEKGSKILIEFPLD